MKENKKSFWNDKRWDQVKRLREDNKYQEAIELSYKITQEYLKEKDE